MKISIFFIAAQTTKIASGSTGSGLDLDERLCGKMAISRSGNHPNSKQCRNRSGAGSVVTPP
jgi:pantoate kinase